MRKTSKSVPVGDIEIACTLVGDGTPVIVIHGAIGLGSTYMRALDPWGNELGLVHYDQRGSGQTELGDVARVSFAGGVEDLEGLRRGLGLERVQLVGHSAGAYLAALYAAAHPESTSSVVLLHPGPPLMPELMQRFGKEMAARRTPADNDARRALEESAEFQSSAPAVLERHQLNTFLPFFRDRATIERVSLGFTAITAANVQKGPERMVGSLGALDPMRRFASIRCPTLVVHAELDPIPVEWTRTLASAIPAADFKVIPGASHFSMIEDAKSLRSAVVPWLRSHASRSSEAHGAASSL
jgi:pimeloyl-ACP methyl ester carboxylesterase